MVNSASALSAPVAEFWAQTSCLLADALDYRKTLEAVGKVLVPRYASRFVIDLLAEDRKLHRVAQSFSNPEFERAVREMAARYPVELSSGHPIAQVVATGRPVLTRCVTDEMLRELAQSQEQLEHYRRLRSGSSISVPLIARGRLLGVLSIGVDAEYAWDESDVAVAEHVAVGCALAIDNARVHEEARANERRLRFLADFTANVTSATRIHDVLAHAAEKIVPEFAEQCVIDLIGEDGNLQRAATAYLDPAKVQISLEIAKNYPGKSDIVRLTGEVVNQGMAALFSALSEADIDVIARDARHRELIRAIGCQSGIVAPLVSRGRVLGVLFLGSELPNRFSGGDLEFATDLGRRCAVALENTLNFEELQRTEEQLRRSNEDLQQFAYAVSHDLKEPLRTVIAFSQLLERRLQADDGTGKMIDTIVAAGLRMSQLIDDVLAYSQAGQDDAIEWLDTAVIVHECLANLDKALREAGAIVSVGTLPELRCSRHLSQVFQNLIGNAIKYRGVDPPRIRIWAERHHDEWRFAVNDNGMGIAERYKADIFEPFKRLHGKELAGTGLGLAISKKIVTRCGGSMWVDSEVGRGSTFWFSLPAKDG